MHFTFPRHPLRYPLHTFRGLLVQPFFWLLFFFSPVFHIFQLDVIHQRMIAWGHSYPFEPWAVGWVPVVFFACVLIIAGVSTLYGRLFCGWVCPHNTLVEWTRSVRLFIGLGQKPFWLKQWEQKWPPLRYGLIVISLVWALAITYTISTLFLFYFVPVSWFVSHIQQGTLPMVVWWGQGLMMLIGLFMIYAGHEFCRSACPYGISQSLSAYLSQKWSPMEIRYRFGEDKSACKSCHACQAACPVDIDPRSPENLIMGVGEGCFNCGECIDACRYVRSNVDNQSLLRFQLNPRDKAASLPREIAH